MGVVMSMRTPKKHSWWRHKLWLCKNYWDFTRRYKCPGCNKTMRCYWDGNDVYGHGIDYCNNCAQRLEAHSPETDTIVSDLVYYDSATNTTVRKSAQLTEATQERKDIP